jgi:hypothetical protein
VFIHAFSLRLYPQQQDTGGFFVTVLEKALDQKVAFPADDGKDAVLSPEPVYVYVTILPRTFWLC